MAELPIVSPAHAQINEILTLLQNKAKVIPTDIQGSHRVYGGEWTRSWMET